MRELAADGIPVVLTCRVLGLARQPYYRWRSRPVTTRELEQAHRANALLDAHRDDPEFGYRYLVDEAGTAGQVMAARTAWALCSANRWWSAFGKPRRGAAKRPGPPVHDDHVQRDFTKNVLDLRTWATRQDLRIVIVTSIERTHHRHRRQDSLGRLTPVEYETINTPQVALAA